MANIREHYNSLLEIQAQLRDHSWSRQLTRYDSEFIARFSTKLQDITNAAYKLTQVPLDLTKLKVIGKSDFYKIILNDDEMREVQEQAKIGLAPDDHIGYKSNFEWIYQDRIILKTAQAQYDSIISEIKRQGG